MKQNKTVESSKASTIDEDYERKFMIRIYKNVDLFKKMENDSKRKLQNQETIDQDSKYDTLNIQTNTDHNSDNIIYKINEIQDFNFTNNDLPLLESSIKVYLDDFSDSESFNEELDYKEIGREDPNFQYNLTKSDLYIDSSSNILERFENQVSNTSYLITSLYEIAQIIPIQIEPIYQDLSFFSRNYLVEKSFNPYVILNTESVYEYVYNQTCQVLYRDFESIAFIYECEQLDNGHFLRSFYENF
jgi:hypothetical protein